MSHEEAWSEEKKRKETGSALYGLMGLVTGIVVFCLAIRESSGCYATGGIECWVPAVMGTLIAIMAVPLWPLFWFMGFAILLAKGGV